MLAEERPGGLASEVEPSGWPSDLGPVPDLVASSPDLAVREPQLATDPLGAQDRLALALRGGVGTGHDLVLVDCPPSLGLLTVNALFAVDAVLLVTEPGAWAVDGVARMVQTIDRIRLRRPDGRPDLVGISVNRLGRTRDGGCRLFISEPPSPRRRPGPFQSMLWGDDPGRPRRQPSSMPS